MIATRRYSSKFLWKCIHRAYLQFCRNISNMSPGDQKNEKSNVTGDSNKSVKESSAVDGGKLTRFNDYDGLLPDRKGDIKVSIIGGGIAAIYAAVLLKQSRMIKCVHLVDPKDSMAGSVLDASHIDTTTRIKYFKKRNIRQGLKEINIIALMDESDTNSNHTDPRAQFQAASNYVRQMTEEMVQYSPESLVAVFVRPVTATLPMISEIYKCAGWWDPDRIIGSIALDCMRMEAITANLLDLNPAFLSVPMVGGADPNTVVPLLSRARPANRFTNAQQNMLLQSLRGADKEIMRMEPRGATLSAGAAAAKLILTLASGLTGCENVFACAFVRSNVLPVCRYFASELQFGPAGVRKNFGLPKVSPSEVFLIEQAIPFINEYVNTAMKAAHSDRLAKLKSA